MTNEADGNPKSSNPALYAAVAAWVSAPQWRGGEMEEKYEIWMEREIALLNAVARIPAQSPAEMQIKAELAGPQLGEQIDGGDWMNPGQKAVMLSLLRDLKRLASASDDSTARAACRAVRRRYAPDRKIEADLKRRRAGKPARGRTTSDLETAA